MVRILSVLAFTACLMAQDYDVLLKNGHVIDPKNNINAVRDVAIKDQKIAAVAANIDASKAKKVVDVKGLYVMPGLIDLHICCYYSRLDLTPSVIADHHCLPSGVTTCCDGGTAGAASFDDFKRIIDRSKMRILSFLNIAAPGAQAAGSEQDPAQFKIQLAIETARKYPKQIIGFKTGHYGGVFSESRPPWASIDAVTKAGGIAGVARSIEDAVILLAGDDA